MSLRSRARPAVPATVRMIPIIVGSLLSLAATVPALAQSTEFIRGDDNLDGGIDVADPIFTLGYLFGSNVPDCLDALDTNDDGGVNIADPIYHLTYLFSAGPAPLAPFPGCGPDPTADALDCTGPVPGCPAGPNATAYRFTSFEIRDPHLFSDALLICTDLTGQLNTVIAGSLIDDADADGFLDLSQLLVFSPVDPTGPGGALELLLAADCTAPVGSTTCATGALGSTYSLPYTNPAPGGCLAPIPGTTNGAYSPPITVPTSPCFVTGATDVVFDIAGLIVDLEATQLSGTYVGSPPTSIVDGMGLGFISEATAAATTIPVSIPLVGGAPLIELLPGGAGNCSSTDERDTGPDGVTLGWYLYFNFTAEEVPFTP